MVSRSAYSVVQVSEITAHILAHKGRYAVIVLPCIAKAFRNAQLVSKELRERVVVLAGLVCGQTKSINFSQYLSSVAGVWNFAAY